MNFNKFECLSMTLAYYFLFFFVCHYWKMTKSRCSPPDPCAMHYCLLLLFLFNCKCNISQLIFLVIKQNNKINSILYKRSENIIRISHKVLSNSIDQKYHPKVIYIMLIFIGKKIVDQKL